MSKVRFSDGGHYMYSMGKTDCCIMQYKHELDIMELSDDEAEGEGEEKKETSGAEATSRGGGGGGSSSGMTPSKSTAPLEELSVSDPFLLDELHAAEALTTKSSESSIPKEQERVKHYLSMIAEPTGFHFKDELLGSTDCDLELQWVHGYRSQDCRNTLKYSSSGEKRHLQLRCTGGLLQQTDRHSALSARNSYRRYPLSGHSPRREYLRHRSGRGQPHDRCLGRKHSADEEHP